MASVEELCDHITLINNSRTLLDGEIGKIRDTYRTNTFRLIFEGNEELLKNSLNGSYELVESSINGNGRMADIRILDQSGPNDLLKALLPKVEIHSFNEILPTMNDIFIRVVEEASAKTKSEQP